MSSMPVFLKTVTMTMDSPSILLIAIFIFSYTACHGDVESIDNVIDYDQLRSGYPALYLGEYFDLNITIVFGTESTQNCSLVVEIDEKLLIVDDYQHNITITNEDDIIPEHVLFQNDETSITINFGNITNNYNVTYVKIPMVLNKPGTIGDLLNITSSILYGSTQEYDLASTTIIYFLGPEVNASMNWNGNDDFVVLNSNAVVSFTVLVPAQTTLADVEIVQEFTSDLSSLSVSYIQCLASSDDANITFSNIYKTNITQFNSTMITPSDHLIRPKRQVAPSPTTSNLNWDIDDVSNTGTDSALFHILISLSIGASPDVTIMDSIEHSLRLNLNSGSGQLSASILGIAIPKLTITKSMELVGREVVDDNNIQVCHFTTVVSHDPSSNAEAFEVTLVDQVNGLIVDYFDGMQPIYGTTGLTVNKLQLTYIKSSLKVGETMRLSYKAYFDADTIAMDTGNQMMKVATVQWQSLPADDVTSAFPGTVYNPIEDSVCVQMKTVMDPSELVTKHGLAALGFFLCVLIGVIIIVVIAVICLRVKHKGPYSMVQPVGASKARGLLTDGTCTGTSSYEDSSLVSVNESIVLILMLDQSSQKYTEIDNLDILSTITVDIDLEHHRVEAMASSLVLLIQQWTYKKLIHKDVDVKSTKKFQRNLKDLTKKMNDEYRRDAVTLRKQLSAMNNMKLTQLKKKQMKKYEKALADTKSIADEEQTQVMQLLQKQHQIEISELSFLLKLQQDEEQEKLRKEYAIRKRMGIKSVQHEYLDEVILQSKLDKEHARKLMMEHWENMAVLEKGMDEEVSRQRMLLEEKLERRKALTEASISQEDHHKSILNTMATQTMGALRVMQEEQLLTEEQINQYTERLRKDVTLAKEKYENDKKKQEEKLHKQLSELKKRRINDKVKEHKQLLEEFEKEQKEKQTTGSFESIEYLESKQKLLGQQRGELNDIDNDLDEEASVELGQLREKLAQNVEQNIIQTKANLYVQLTSKGLTEDMTNELLEEHQRNVEQLKEEQEEEKLKQEDKLKKRLAKKRKDWMKRKADEREEQEQIREHESKLVGKLLATQLIMSEADRDKIMHEHEKQMVTLENNLTLNKLRQKRMLEEKLAVKRTRQMEKLEKKQQLEERRQLRSKQLDSDAEDDTAEVTKDMMKKHAEERISLLSNEKTQADDELDSIRVEMLQERAYALKSQEEQLGSLMAQLQVEKAREMATIEEQQRALLQLKMNMLDDMTERGVIKNAQCKKVIENHQKEVQQLETKMNDERGRQEKEFKKRFKEKQLEREKTFMHEQELQLARIMDLESNSTKARLRRVAFKHKQTMELEDFRQKIQTEIRQSLEDLRRTFEIKKLKAVQEQELQFIGNLMRHGKYEHRELMNILQLFFPTKTETQLKELMLKMQTDKDNEDTNEDEDDIESKKGNLISKFLQGTNKKSKIESQEFSLRDTRSGKEDQSNHSEGDIVTQF